MGRCLLEPVTRVVDLLDWLLSWGCDDCSIIVMLGLSPLVLVCVLAREAGIARLRLGDRCLEHLDTFATSRRRHECADCGDLANVSGH